jgi:hypothetical protein
MWERCIWGFGGGNLSERDHLEDSDIEEKIILKWVFRKWDGSMDRVDLAQNWNRWRELVKNSTKYGEFF